MRLQKILSAHAVASRRAAEKMIEDGRVTVNGRVACLGDSADPEQDTILIDGKPLPKRDQAICLMLNKPRGYITTLSDEKGRKTAASLVEGCGCRVYPVGRLDCASEGLLLFTNDGELANRLMHPRGEIEKVYSVTVRGAKVDTLQALSSEALEDGTKIRPPKVRLLREQGDKTTFEITIHEGKNRQVRRMCEAAGLTVARLCRIREGCVTLGNLPVGKWRALTQEELEALRLEAGQ